LIGLFCGYLLLIPVGTLALYLSSTLAAGNELTADRARFAVINALTITGFQGGFGIHTYPLPGQITILLLVFIGSAFSMIVGGLAVVRIVRLPFADGQVVRAGLLACATLAVLGALPLVGYERDALEALMLSISALGNCGLFLGQLPAMTSWQTHLVILPLAVIGALGLPVLMELGAAAIGRRPISFYSRTVLWLTAAIYLGGFALLLLLRWLSVPSLPQGSADTARFIASASVASINARGLGLPYEFAQDLPRLMRWGVLLLMIIGGNPASTAGGLKATCLYELGRSTWRLLAGRAPGRATGFAMLWVGTYTALVVLAFFLLLAADPQVTAERGFFDVVSAVSNAGLSTDRIYLVMPGLDVLSGAMLLGRLTPLLILWWMARSTVDADLPVA
jgi:trk system potassium uptake protein